jgi:predicted enzyme related to lactoylglutathione lyase
MAEQNQRSRWFVEDVLAAKQFYGSVFGLPGRKMIRPASTRTGG